MDGVLWSYELTVQTHGLLYHMRHSDVWWCSAMGKWTGLRQTCVQIWALLSISCVTLGKSLYLLSFPGDNSCYTPKLWSLNCFKIWKLSYMIPWVENFIPLNFVSCTKLSKILYYIILYYIILYYITFKLCVQVYMKQKWIFLDLSFIPRFSLSIFKYSKIWKNQKSRKLILSISGLACNFIYFRWAWWMKNTHKNIIQWGTKSQYISAMIIIIIINIITVRLYPYAL
jgi:hypothetical protein